MSRVFLRGKPKLEKGFFTGFQIEGEEKLDKMNAFVQNEQKTKCKLPATLTMDKIFWQWYIRQYLPESKSKEAGCKEQ